MQSLLHVDSRYELPGNCHLKVYSRIPQSFLVTEVQQTVLCCISFFVSPITRFSRLFIDCKISSLVKAFGFEMLCKEINKTEVSTQVCSFVLDFDAL